MILRVLLIAFASPFVVLYLLARRPFVGAPATSLAADRLGQSFKRYVVGKRYGGSDQ